MVVEERADDCDVSLGIGLDRPGRGRRPGSVSVRHERAGGTGQLAGLADRDDRVRLAVDQQERPLAPGPREPDRDQVVGPHAVDPSGRQQDARVEPARQAAVLAELVVRAAWAGRRMGCR